MGSKELQECDQGWGAEPLARTPSPLSWLSASFSLNQKGTEGTTHKSQPVLFPPCLPERQPHGAVTWQMLGPGWGQAGRC